MFGKKYIFETSRTKYRRYFRNTLLFFSSFSIFFFLFGPYILYQASKEKELANLQFFQKSPDAIVVFTGDKGRIPKAVELSKKHESAKVFISGVYAKNTVEKLIKMSTEEEDQVDSLGFIIDYQARNTLENVISLFSFLKKEPELKKVLIISSDYHIYRIKKIISAMQREDFDHEFFYFGTDSNHFSLRGIKILYKEVYKIIQAQAFLMLWDSEVIE